jgi:hypothetical protein
MNMTYEDLKKFDIKREDSGLIIQVRQLLYDFSYSDLEKKYPVEHKLLRKSIINYLYSGQFTLLNDLHLINTAEVKLKKAIFKDYKKAIDNLNKIVGKSKEFEKKIKSIQKIKTDVERNFKFEEHFYNAYFEIWHVINKAHKDFIENIELVNYLLIYEAAPYSNEINDYDMKHYFLTSNVGNYANCINNCFNSKDDVQKVLKDNNVAYFDLIMGCLPIADENKEFGLRKKWCYNAEFKIGGKALPIVLLELGICYVLKNVKKPIIKFPKIAIGAPVNTSRSIFEYYTDNPMKVLINNLLLPNFLDSRQRKELDICKFIFLPDKSSRSLKDCTEILFIDISGPNSINGFKKYKKKGVFLPLHKANIISAANSPNGDFLKNAFDNY